jgi:L-cystine uptake protein TcyP (sodium:dicarboxylate symporter family)
MFYQASFCFQAFSRAFSTTNNRFNWFIFVVMGNNVFLKYLIWPILDCNILEALAQIIFFLKIPNFSNSTFLKNIFGKEIEKSFGTFRNISFKMKYMFGKHVLKPPLYYDN